MYILAQILAVLAIITWVISILLKEKKDILLSQAVSNLIYGLEYLFLNAVVASYMNFCSFIRLLIFYNFEKKKKEIPKSILLIFIIIILFIGIFTYTNLFSFIPIIITLLYAYSIWQNNLFITRLVYVICAFVWIYYNYYVGAYVGIIGNILEIISGCIAIFVYRKKA